MQSMLAGSREQPLDSDQPVQLSVGADGNDRRTLELHPPHSGH